MSYKTFRGSGAAEFFGKVDTVNALQWLENIEKGFHITGALDDDKVSYATAMFMSSALTW